MKSNKPRATPHTAVPRTDYLGRKVPMSAIRRYAQDVAARFKPQKIILFGSYAYGKPKADSDVDLLVVMPAANQHSQAVRIRWAVPAPFPLDLLVRTPGNMQGHLKAGESFHSEIARRGKVLYAEGSARLGSEGRGRLSRGSAANGRRRATS